MLRGEPGHKPDQLADLARRTILLKVSLPIRRFEYTRAMLETSPALPRGLQHGFWAQDVQETIPQAVRVKPSKRVGKETLQEGVRRMIAQCDGRPMLRSSSTDGTPLTFTATVRRQQACYSSGLDNGILRVVIGMDVTGSVSC